VLNLSSPNLCFLNHDLLSQFLVKGQKNLKNSHPPLKGTPIFLAAALQLNFSVLLIRRAQRSAVLDLCLIKIVLSDLMIFKKHTLGGNLMNKAKVTKLSLQKHPSVNFNRRKK